MKDSVKKGLKDWRNWLLLCWPLGFICYQLSLSDRELAEKVFNGVIFRAYSALMSRLTGWLPFSLGELLLIALPLVLIGYFVKQVIFSVRLDKKFTGANGNAQERMWAVSTMAKIRRETGLKSLRNLLMIAGIIYLWYMIGCGTNYYRYEFTEFSGYTIEKSTKDELKSLAELLTQRANAAGAQLRAEKTGEGEAYRSEYSYRELAGLSREAMMGLAQTYDCMEGYYPRPKPVAFSELMSRLGITGIYSPFTVEANVNYKICDFMLGVTMCHELAHLRGFMREDEANYLAFRACVESDTPEFRYSGYMLALIHTGNRLYEVDKEAYYEVAAGYSEELRADLKANNEYWSKYEEGKLDEVGENMNNSYLKANHQEDGTRSYGRMVDLLLAQMRADGI